MKQGGFGQGIYFEKRGLDRIPRKVCPKSGDQTPWTQSDAPEKLEIGSKIDVCTARRALAAGLDVAIPEGGLFRKRLREGGCVKLAGNAECIQNPRAVLFAKSSCANILNETRK